MKNITKLSIWPQLKALGFVPIRYHAHGKVVAVGASLQQDHIDITNKPFKSDIITIEPKACSFSDKKHYYITGKINTPFYETLYRVNGIGRKEPIVELKERMNEFYAARDILKVVELMMK